jgi:hypothetical protein
MPKGVIYTSIFGNYDELIEPHDVNFRLSYVCFTDNEKLKSDVWDIRVIEPKVPGDNNRSARYVKINAHEFLPDFDYSMYIDGNMRLLKTPNILSMLDGYKLVMVGHPTRDCVYKEASICAAIGKDSPEAIASQVQAYREYGFPNHGGLYETGFHLKRHNDTEVIDRFKCWWEQIETYSFRDQLSFPFVFQGFPMKTIHISERSEYVKITSLHPCLYRS